MNSIKKSAKGTTMRRHHILIFLPKTRRKLLLHAIRRDEGEDFRVAKKNKVCSRHFRPSDLKNSFNGRVYLKGNAMPSKFKWYPESPRKWNGPAVQLPSRAMEKT